MLRAAPHDLTITPDVVLRLTEASVLVVGDLMLDRYVSGAVSRVSPEAPVPVLLAGDQRTVLGGAANVAANVVALGGRAVVCGQYGDDIAGDELERLCADAGVALDRTLRRRGLSTIVKQRLVAGSQQLLRVDWERYESLSSRAVSAVLERLRGPAGAGEINALVISDYAKGTVTPALARALITSARDLGIPVVVDPKGTVLDHYSGATVIKPNITEARRMASVTLDRPEDSSLGELSHVLHRLVEVDNFVISMAADGVALCPGRGTVETFRSLALEVADVSGAGDTMVAALAAGLGASVSVAEVVELGNVAAGLACSRLGTVVVTMAELAGQIARLSLPSDSPHIVQDWERLAHLVALQRTAGARVVFTNGCFDLLHGGHVALLEQARRQGDVLVVGLNSDASVQRLKGPTRPLQGLDHRLRVMAAVRFVDYVTAFEEDTPLDLILRLRPDVIVKGGDYEPEAVVGGEEAKAWHGEVHIVSTVDGLSTTQFVTPR